MEIFRKYYTTRKKQNKKILNDVLALNMQKDPDTFFASSEKSVEGHKPVAEKTEPRYSHTQNIVPQEKPMKRIIAGILIALCVGCAGPVFVTQAIEDEPSLLVGLASYKDQSKATAIRHDHPVEWSKADLHAILKRLFIQEGGGLMDSARPLQAVFSPEDMTSLIPSLHKTFKIAQPSDWIVFAIWGSSGKSQTLEVTSGGMFLEDQRLHIIVANHRERVSSAKDGIQAIRSNPFHSLSDVKGGLMFYPSSYVIDSRNSWIIGGFESPVSELILDYQALLGMKSLEKPTETEEPHTASEISRTDSSPARLTDSDAAFMKKEISNLKEELSRLQHQITQQDAERPRIKIPSKILPSSTSSPEPTKTFP